MGVGTATSARYLRVGRDRRGAWGRGWGRWGQRLRGGGGQGGDRSMRSPGRCTYSCGCPCAPRSLRGGPSTHTCTCNTPPGSPPEGAGGTGLGGGRGRGCKFSGCTGEGRGGPVLTLGWAVPFDATKAQAGSGTGRSGGMQGRKGLSGTRQRGAGGARPTDEDLSAEPRLGGLGDGWVGGERGQDRRVVEEGLEGGRVGQRQHLVAQKAHRGRAGIHPEGCTAVWACDCALHGKRQAGLGTGGRLGSSRDRNGAWGQSLGSTKPVPFPSPSLCRATSTSQRGPTAACAGPRGALAAPDSLDTGPKTTADWEHAP